MSETMSDDVAVFEQVQVVTLADVNAPKLAYSFPASSSTDVREFAFPESPALLSKLVRRRAPPQTFSFVLTSDDGTRRFGYCRRFFGSSPPGLCFKHARIVQTCSLKLDTHAQSALFCYRIERRLVCLHRFSTL